MALSSASRPLSWSTPATFSSHSSFCCDCRRYRPRPKWKTRSRSSRRHWREPRTRPTQRITGNRAATVFASIAFISLDNVALPFLTRRQLGSRRGGLWSGDCPGRDRDGDRRDHDDLAGIRFASFVVPVRHRLQCSGRPDHRSSSCPRDRFHGAVHRPGRQRRRERRCSTPSSSAASRTRCWGRTFGAMMTAYVVAEGLADVAGGSLPDALNARPDSSSPGSGPQWSRPLLTSCFRAIRGPPSPRCPASWSPGTSDLPA